MAEFPLTAINNVHIESLLPSTNYFTTVKFVTAYPGVKNNTIHFTINKTSIFST